MKIFSNIFFFSKPLEKPPAEVQIKQEHEVMIDGKNQPDQILWDNFKLKSPFQNGHTKQTSCLNGANTWRDLSLFLHMISRADQIEKNKIKSNQIK